MNERSGSRCRVLVAAVAVTVALAACAGCNRPSSSSSSSSSSSTVTAARPTGGRPSDLCKLATKADVEKAFGGTVADGVSTKDHCRYAISGKLKSGQIVNPAMGGYVEISWNSHVMKKNSPIAKATLEPLSGFDNAWYEKEGQALMVEARAGELTYQGKVPLTEKDPIKPALVELATATYARPD